MDILMSASEGGRGGREVGILCKRMTTTFQFVLC